ncbi:MAG: hypothetical protein Q8R35_03555 [bacterium]|nr:hypothetical protein [bacterium]
MKPWQALLAAVMLLGIAVVANACMPPPRHIPPVPRMDGDGPGRPSVRGILFPGPH